MGVPLLILVLADNQVGIAEGLDREGAAVSLGWGRELSTSTLRTLQDIACSPIERDRLALRGRELIDGRGVLRVVSAMRSSL